VGIRQTELNRLYARSGNRCAYTGCRRVLVVLAGAGQPLVTLGEVAHIVASSPAGPRGASFLPPGDRDKYENLILLCNTHHQLIDAKAATYTPERLQAMKADHEQWVEQRLAASVAETAEPEPFREDRLFSTLLPVTRMPKSVFVAPSRFKTEEEIKARLGPLRGTEMTPFILRENKVFAFQDLRVRGNPFEEVIRGRVERHRLEDWIEDPDQFLWLITLLNRSLNKLTGRRGLQLDKEHRRYYFPMLEPGEPRYETYQPPNASESTLSVVWQPTRRATGEPRKHWFHRAVGLRFARIGPGEWCLSLRPELRVTVDGVTPVESRSVGAKVTRKKSRLFNYELLKEVQFWRDFLSGRTPRVVFFFGRRDQRITISSDLMEGQILWPGIPARHAMPFRNVSFVDDLFTWAEAELIDEGQGGVEADQLSEVDDEHELG
jgi:hypothetical protein